MVFVGVIASAAAAAGLIWAFRRPIECGSHTDLGPYVAGLSAACLVGCICQGVLNRRTNQPLASAIGLGALAGFAAFQLWRAKASTARCDDPRSDWLRARLASTAPLYREERPSTAGGR